MERIIVVIFDADYTRMLAYRTYPLGQPDTAFLARLDALGYGYSLSIGMI